MGVGRYTESDTFISADPSDSEIELFVMQVMLQAMPLQGEIKVKMPVKL